MPHPSLPELMDLLLDAICIVDKEGRFISISGACERIFGYRPEEMIGRPMIEFVHPDDRDRTLQAVDRIEAGYLQRDFVNRYIRKDGSIVRIMWSARRSEKEQIRVAVARDITDRQTDTPAGSAVPPENPAKWRLSAAPPRLIPPGFAPIPLSSQDYTVLLALVSGNGPVTRKAIVDALGEDFLHYDQRRLDTQMRRLRRKVEAACGLTLPVRTLRSVGYHFYDEIELGR